MLLSMEYRDYDIMAHGYGNIAFTDYGKEKMAERFLDEFGDDLIGTADLQSIWTAVKNTWNWPVKESPSMWAATAAGSGVGDWHPDPPWDRFRGLLRFQGPDENSKDAEGGEGVY